MTCGIYRLTFKGTDKCYIGQSSNIESRYNVHIHALKHSVSSKKLQQAYKDFGTPELTIIIECNEEDLNANENEAIEIFDAVKNGFNTLERSEDIPRARGELNGRAKIPNSLVEVIFKLLISDKDILYSTVAEHTGVTQNTVRKIASGENHSWLSGKYPEEYKYLLSLKNSRRAHSKITGKIHPTITSPLGELFDIPEGKVREFCVLHGLDRAHLGAVLRGKEKQHKGWRLLNE